MYILDKKDKFVILLGILSLFKIRFVGTFSISEIIIFCYYPFLKTKLFLENNLVKRLMWLAAIWLVGSIISDIINETPLELALKGTFNIIFIILLIPFVYWALYDKSIRLVYFCFGYAVSSMINFFFITPVKLEEGYDVWRTYAFLPVAILFAGYYYYKGKNLLSYIIAESFGIWALFHASRSIFLFISIVVAFLLYLNFISRNRIEETIKIYKRTFLSLVFVLCFAGFVIDVFYEYAAGKGILGEYAYEKYLDQKSSSMGVATGRADFFVGLAAFAESPLIGYGSYAMDKGGFRVKWYSDHGYLLTANQLQRENLMPSHSHLIGAIVFSGILGAFFWLYILKHIILSITSGNVLRCQRLLGIYLLLAFAKAWDILFSPLDNRLILLMVVIMTLMINNKYIKYS